VRAGADPKTKKGVGGRLAQTGDEEEGEAKEHRQGVRRKGAGPWIGRAGDGQWLGGRRCQDRLTKERTQRVRPPVPGGHGGPRLLVRWLLRHCVTVSLSHCVTVSLCHSVPVSLYPRCPYATVSLCHCVTAVAVSLRLCVTVSLSHCVSVPPHSLPDRHGRPRLLVR